MSDNFPPPPEPSGWGPPDPVGRGTTGVPAGFGPPGYYGLAEHPQGTLVLVLGILGLVTCPLIGPFAWAMGNTALREIDAAGGASNRGVVVAGRILGIISSVIMLAVVSVVILMFLLAIVAR